MGSWFSTPAAVKPLVILDMNKLLVYRAFKPKLHEEYAHVEHLIDQATLLGEHYTFLRPGARDFVNYLLDHYRVAVWSSAWAKNVNLLCDHVFGPRRSELLFEWDQTMCTTIVPHPDPDETKPLFRKDLAKVWQEYTEYGADNTVIIDDCSYKMAQNPEHCVILTKPWVPPQDGDFTEILLKLQN